MGEERWRDDSMGKRKKGFLDLTDLTEIGTEGRIELDYGKIEREKKKRQEEERWSKIIESRYNECYREIKNEGLSKYLTTGWEGGGGGGGGGCLLSLGCVPVWKGFRH